MGTQAKVVSTRDVQAQKRRWTVTPTTPKGRLAAAERDLCQAKDELRRAEANAGSEAVLATARRDGGNANSELAEAYRRLGKAQATYDLLHLRFDEQLAAVRTEEMVEQIIPIQKPTVHEAVHDAEGFDLRPDPLQATTPRTLIEALRLYRIWAGEPSYREIARRAGSRAAASSICTALKNDSELPGLPIVLAVVIGCGGSEEDRSRFATAWRRLRLTGDGREDRERPELRALPASQAG